MPDTGKASVSIAITARAALRYMAVNRMVPTPGNYARAWDLVGGEAGIDSGPVDGEVTDSGPETRPLSGAAVLELHGAAGGLAAEAAEAVRQANRRMRLVQTLTDLVDTMCDAVPELAWGEGWVTGQFDAIRQSLHPENGLPDRGALLQVADDLKHAVAASAEARALRRAALEELKGVLPQWLNRVSSLSDTSREFGEKLSGFAQRVEAAGSLEELATMLTSIVSDTDQLNSSMNATRGDLDDSVQRAEALEMQVMELSRELSKTHAQIYCDDLTGLLNRRGLESAFAEIRNEAARSNSPVAVAMLDLDGLKPLNDTYGHAAGDQALCEFARRIQARFRPGDRAARFGGDEFVIILPGVDASPAGDIVDRLRRVHNVEALMGGPGIPVPGFSAGISTVVNGDLRAALERADDALYEAKRSGKNRIVVRD